MNISVSPIFPITQRTSREEGHVETRREIDSKISGLVHKRINNETEQKSKTLKVHIAKGKKAPIGLKAVDPGGWLNALMQLVLFVPGFSELFFFTPRSFSPFKEFIDQYNQDQSNNRSVSSANGMAIFRFLSSKLTRISLSEVFEFLISTLNPDWKIYQNIDEALRGGRPSGFFVTENFKRKQIFTVTDRVCYDLSAFIEVRPDGSQTSFIAYVKVDGIWYQCDDDRVTQLRSNNLEVPLKRGTLFYYQRIRDCH